MRYKILVILSLTLLNLPYLLSSNSLLFVSSLVFWSVLSSSSDRFTPSFFSCVSRTPTQLWNFSFSFYTDFAARPRLFECACFLFLVSRHGIRRHQIVPLRTGVQAGLDSGRHAARRIDDRRPSEARQIDRNLAPARTNLVWISFACQRCVASNLPERPKAFETHLTHVFTAVSSPAALPSLVPL